jgi:hypothetical protein
MGRLHAYLVGDPIGFHSRVRLAERHSKRLSVNLVVTQSRLASCRWPGPVRRRCDEFSRAAFFLTNKIRRVAAATRLILIA